MPDNFNINDSFIPETCIELNADELRRILGLQPPARKDEVADEDLPFDGDDDECPATCDGDCEFCGLDDDDDDCEILGYEIPAVRSVIFNGPATTILWSDGTKTTVKCAADQVYDRYAGFSAAVMKKLFDSTAEAKKVMDAADVNRQKAIAAEREAERKAAIAARERTNAAKKAAQRKPSFSQFQDMVFDRAMAKLVEQEADNLLETVRAKMYLDSTTEEILRAFRNKGKEEKENVQDS